MRLYYKKAVLFGVTITAVSSLLSGCAINHLDPMVTHRATCLDYGFQYGTPEYAKCIQKEQLSAQKNRAQTYQSQKTYYDPAPTTYVGTYYTTTSFHDSYAIDREMAKLKRESKRRKNEAALKYQRRLEENRLRQDELLRLQREQIRYNERKLQDQRHKEMRREQDSYRREQKNYRQEAKRQQEQSDYALAARLQAEEFEKERKRLQQEREQQRQQENYNRIQQQEIQRQRDKAEQAHVKDLYRRQEQERQEQARKNGYSSNKSAVQQQIDNDHALALALQKEEYGL